VIGTPLDASKLTGYARKAFAKAGIATCSYCGHAMDGTDCLPTLIKDGETFDRIRDGQGKFPAHTGTETCHDCGAVADGIHHLGCGMEECPVCGGQLFIYALIAAHEHGCIGRPQLGTKFGTKLEGARKAPSSFHRIWRIF
jgi:hypothetical protein